MPATKTRTLSTAEERREAVLVAAKHAFATRGLHGTPTMEIAKAAGISQAYLFRLFPTKLDLFLTLVKSCNERIQDTFVDAAAVARRDGEDVINAMGAAYRGLLDDRDLLLIQLHAHAASDDPVIRDCMRRGFAELVEVIQRESGADEERISNFFAHGMLLNVLAAMDIESVADQPWAQILIAGPDGDEC